VKLFPLALFTKITLLAGILALVCIGTSQLYFARHERAALQLRLTEKANFVTNFYAFLIADALSRNDDVTLQQVITRLEEDAEVASVVVVDERREVRYHADPEKVATILDDPLLLKSFESGDGVASQSQNRDGMTLVCPLKVRGRTAPMGAVRIEFTYNHINSTVRKGQASFLMVSFGILSMFVGGMHWGLRRWVIRPMGRLRAGLSNINPVMLDAGLPEPKTEWGEINGAINQLLTRIRAEWDSTRSGQAVQADSERRWVERLALAFMPDIRILAADRDNRILTDTGLTSGQEMGGDGASAVGSHLLDLLSDETFASLMTNAFKSEGQVVRGQVTFQTLPYDAAIVRAPEEEARLVKTVIALRPIKTT